MTDRASRHANQPTYRRPIDGQPGEVELYEPRFRTPPPAERIHTAERSDRLDLLAYRYLEDPHQYWHIADANPEIELESLLEPGTELKIPRPPS